MARATTVATPTFGLAAGTYTGAQSVTISDSTSGSTIYYTTNGTTPTTSSTKYTGAISVSTTETLKALATATGDTNSAVASAAYTIVVPAPTFSPAAGSYGGSQTVTISDSNSAATIYYTTNGTTPTTSSTKYTSAITVSSSETLEALATATGDTNSAVATAAYTIVVPTPTFSPAAGSYGGSQTVTISDSNSAATIYYTTNGTTPTTSSTKYTSAITVNSSETLEALATATGDTNSAVATAAYTFIAPTPTFSLTGGSYFGSQTVTISDSNSAATIYYTTNGTTPTISSTHYTGAITVGSTETLEALAVITGYTNSSVATVTYTITTTPGTLSIYLSPPAAQSTTVSGASTETFDALSTGIHTSAYVSTAGIGTYTGSSTQPFAIMAPDEYGGATDSTSSTATNYFAVGTESGSSNPVYLALAQPVSYFGFWWSAGDQYNRVALYSGSSLYGTFSTADLLGFLNNGSGTITASNGTAYETSAYFGNPNITSGTNDSGEPFAYVSFAITGATITQIVFYNTSTGTGFESDNHSVIFNGNSVTIPSTFVPVESLTLGSQVATPVFAPQGTPLTVAITSSTPGASINYTTNGTTPTSTTGTAYTGPISVGQTETIEAIAFETGMTTSAVASAVYTIPTLTVVSSSNPSTYGGSVTFTATISSGPTGTVTFYDAGTSIGTGTISGATATFTTTSLAAGAHTITASWPGNSSYGSVLSASIAQTVNVATQTISFTASSPVAYGISPIALSASGGGSGNPVTFSVLSGPGSVSGSTLTITGVGTVVVAANQTGNSNFSAAGQVTQSIVVDQGTQAITFVPPSSPVTYGVSPIALTASGGASGNAIVFSVLSGPGSVSGSTLTITGAGTVVVAANQAGNVDYAAAPQVTQSVVVNQIAPTITFTVSNQVYGVAPFAVSATSNSSGAITYSVVSGPATISGSTATITGAGTVVLQASQASNGNYAAGTQNASFTVSPEAPTLTFTVANQTYGVAPFIASASSNSSGAITYSVVSGPASISGSTVTVTGTGTVVLQASQAASGNYTAGTQNATFTVSAEAQTITFTAPASPVIYGVAPITLSATSSSGLPVTFSVLSGPGTISGSTLTITGTGTVTIAADQAGNANYLAAAEVTQSIVVSPLATVTVNPSNATLAGGQTEQFAASVSNVSNTAVTWSINPSGLGTVSAAGLYTAPATVSSLETVTITATSQAETSQSGSATITLSPSSCVPNGYSYQRAITIDHTKVHDTDQVNFPIVFNTTDAALANTAYGGHVSSSSGYDIFFASDAAGQNVLNSELEEYNPATGQLIEWIRIPTLSHSTDTVIYMFYGNPSITSSQQTPTGVWDSNFGGVYHLTNLGTGAVQDSTINGNNGSNVGVTAASGILGGSGSFANGTSYVLLPNSPSLKPPTNLTLEAWVNPSSLGTWSKVIGLDYQANGSWNYPYLTYALQNYSDTNAMSMQVTSSGNDYYFSSQAQIPLNAWSHVVGTYDGSQMVLYVDGVPSTPSPLSGSIDYGTSQAVTIGARSPYSPSATEGWNGLIEEVRISSVARSADWIATEFNNQGSPSTFYAVSPEENFLTPSAVSLSVSETQQFSAPSLGACAGWTISPANAGTINSSGLYTAPATITSEENVTVSVTSLTGTSQSGQATITLFPPSSVSLTVAPSSATLYAGQSQQFTATLTDLTNTGVAWSISPANAGTITATGLYAAPTLISTEQTVTITATSLADGAFTTSSIVTLMPAINVSVSPSSAVLYSGQTQQFTADVTNAANTTVTWSLDPSGAGSISSNGFYTAPSLSVPANSFSASSLLLNGSASVTLDGYLQLTDGGAYEVSSAWSTSVLPIDSFTTDFNFLLVVPGPTSGADGITFTIQQAGPTALGGAGGCIGFCGISNSVGVKFDTYNNQGEGIDSTGLFTDGADPTIPAIDLTSTGINLHSNDVMHAHLAYDGTNLTLALTDTVTNATATEVFPIDIPGTVGGNTAYVGFTAATGSDISTQQILSWSFSSLGEQTIGVTATSVADPTKAGHAEVTLMPVVGVSAQPASAVLYGGQTQQFSANVTNAANSAVLWSITPATGAGTISQSGLYTAPASVTAQQSATITATSAAAPTAFATMAISLVPQVSLSVAPTSAQLTNGQTQQFTATVISGASAAVTWTVLPAQGTIIPTSAGVGTVSSTGLYTAPANITQQFSVIVIATSAANPSIFALATINLVPPSSGGTGTGPGTIDISISSLNTLTLPNSLALTAAITDSTGLTPTVAWTEVSGPGTVTFSNPQQAVTSASFSEAGYYILQLSASDSSGNTASAQWPIVVNLEGENQGWIGSPSNGSMVSGLVPITVAQGISLQSGVLTYYAANNPNGIVTLNNNTVGSGQIGTFDTTMLPNGSYWLQLVATTSGGDSENNLILVTVTGNYKPGRVTATVTDLVVPATGLPINIQRTYDSLNAAASGDFGYGWNLGFNVNLTVGPDGSVTFTLAGQRRTFYLTPQPNGLLPYDDVIFTPQPGFFGTLTDSQPGCQDDFDYVVPDGSIWLCVGGGQYNPPGYVYTDANGTSYLIAATGALKAIQDRSGNQLTITPSGITSTTGLNVPFVRDSQNRITQITDPAGNTYLYSYDANGQLASVTYPNTAQPSTYTYTPSGHYYLSGTDFRDNPLPVTAYFDSSTDGGNSALDGRLLSVTNTAGTTSYAYNLATNTTTITYPADANGNVGSATMVYDSYGMLLSSTDPLGDVTTNAYDVNHNLTSATDPLGNVTSYSYDANGNKVSSTYPATLASSNTTSTTQYNQYSEPTSTIDELGNTRVFNYDANFNPQSVTDALGTLASFSFNANQTLAAGAIGFDITASPANASQFTYDANGNLASRTDALGRTTSYVYNSLGQKLSMTSPTPASPTGGSASTTTYTYDQLGNLLQTAAPLSRTTSSTYDGNGNKISDTDARGNITGYQYDSLNRLIETDYPDSTKATKTYDFRNNVLLETDQNGNVTQHTYDLAGRQIKVVRGYGTASASATSYVYDSAGRKISETDALGHTTAYSYDADSRLVAIAGVQGNFTYTYDNASNRVAQTDGNGNTTQFQYDARKRLTATLYPDGTSTVNAYDGPGNLASVTDQNQNVVLYSYDAANQLSVIHQTASPDTDTNYYGYDDLGNLIQLTDERFHTTTNSFDLFNEPVSKVLPDGTLTETRTYDNNGNLTSLVHFNGVATTYTYDALNRLLSRVTSGEPTVSFTYTSTGKRATMTDGSGTTTYSYDSLDRLTAKATPEGTLTYSYDGAGNVASVSSSHANGVSVSYAYDGQNRLSTVTDARLSGNQATTYSYDPASNVVAVNAANGVQSAMTYDTLNRVSGMATQSAAYLYQHEPAGHLTGATELSGRTLAWTFDGIYRLTNETISSDPINDNGTSSFTLDAVGNRTGVTTTIPGLTSGGFGYGADDLMSTEAYDNNGNVTATSSNTYSYDAENHLISMGGGAVTLVYDGDGNRVAKTVGGVTTQYLVDDMNPTGYAQVVEELASGAVTRQYTYGLQRISQRQIVSNTWTVSFYGYDGGGNVRQLTNSGGAVTDSYEYDAFGNALTKQGTTPNNYLYRGEQYDSDLGFYYLRARYYNPLTGRFMSRDPEDGKAADPKTLHKYLYAGGDPINAVDPTGRDLFETALIEGGSLQGPIEAAIARAITPYVIKTLACTAYELLWNYVTPNGSHIPTPWDCWGWANGS